MARFAGCLFDMDGLLLDTERVGLDVFVSVMGQEGIAVGLADAFYRRVVGTSGDATRAALSAEFPNLDPHAIDEAWHDQLHAAMAETVPLRPKVAETLSALAQADVPMAVVTTTMTPRARAHLQKAGLLAFFRDVLGRDRVVAPKPDPAPYLAGAAALNLAPGACAAFEDSDTGTRAAVAAGCATWQIPDLRPPDRPLPALGQSMAADLADAVRQAGF